MQLKVTGVKSIRFVKFILGILRQRIIENINEKKLNIWEKYINDNKLFYGPSTLYLSLYPVIQAGIKNLVYEFTEDGFDIYINKTKMLQGTTYKLNLVIQTIDQGNIERDGLKLFSEAFDYIAKNIEKYYGDFRVQYGMYGGVY